MVHLKTLGEIDLRHSDGREVLSVVSQPKRLALLAYLAVEASGRFAQRDRLADLFWPEHNAVRARANLRKALSYLRRSLGADILTTRGDHEVGVDPERIWCDARVVLDGGVSPSSTGLFLDAVHISGTAHDFDAWVDSVRARLQQSKGRMTRSSEPEPRTLAVLSAVPSRGASGSRRSVASPTRLGLAVTVVLSVLLLGWNAVMGTMRPPRVVLTILRVEQAGLDSTWVRSLSGLHDDLVEVLSGNQRVDVRPLPTMRPADLRRWLNIIGEREGPDMTMEVRGHMEGAVMRLHIRVDDFRTGTILASGSVAYPSFWPLSAEVHATVARAAASIVDKALERWSGQRVP